jgi:hypothetical protein
MNRQHKKKAKQNHMQCDSWHLSRVFQKKQIQNGNHHGGYRMEYFHRSRMNAGQCREEVEGTSRLPTAPRQNRQAMARVCVLLENGGACESG